MDDDELADAHPGYAPLITHLAALASTYPPPFVFITDPANPRITASVVDALFRASIPGAPPTRYARVNAVACLTARVFFDSVLNALADWTPAWQDGCQVWPGDDDPHRYNDSIDSFLHGLARLHLEHPSNGAGGNGKGKARAATSDSREDPSMVILIERAERLSETLPELLVPLSRLAELSRTNVSVILLSSVSWEDIRPALGASPDPYYVDVEPLEKRDVLQRLVSGFHTTSQSFSQSPSSDMRMAYHPALQPLYEHYVDTLYDTISVYTTDPLELQYVAAARWPGFVKPIITQYQELVRQSGEDQDEDEPAAPELEPPGTEGRLRLFKFFLPTFTAALDALYPRLDNASDWAAKNDYDPTASGGPAGPSNQKKKPTSSLATDHRHLPRVSKFILIAAFLASTNPPKSDLRMFGRGPEERRKRRRRKSVSPRKGAQTVVKASQRLLGPLTFPLDRLIAILGVLLEEHDHDDDEDPQFGGGVSGAHTDMEIGRVHVYAAIAELTLMRALHRTSAADKLLDGPPPTLKCGVSYEVVGGFARELGVPLNEMLWDPV